MSYIEIELGGKPRGLKFNQLSLEVYSKNINFEAIKTSTIYATFFAGLMGNSYAKRLDPDYTFEDVCGWVDDLYEKGKIEVINNVCDLWAETNIYRTWLKEFQEKVRAKMHDKEGEVKAKPKNKKKVR